MLPEPQFQLKFMSTPSYYVNLKTDFGRHHALTATQAVHTVGRNFQKSKSNILIFSPSACLLPIRSPDSQQQPCERSCQQTEDAQVQLKQSSPPSSHLLPPFFPHEDEKMTITSRQSFNVLTVIFLLLSTAGL